jgi:hypothetical protein
MMVAMDLHVLLLILRGNETRNERLLWNPMSNSNCSGLHKFVDSAQSEPNWCGILLNGKNKANNVYVSIHSMEHSKDQKRSILNSGLLQI